MRETKNGSTYSEYVSLEMYHTVEVSGWFGDGVVCLFVRYGMTMRERERENLSYWSLMGGDVFIVIMFMLIIRRYRVHHLSMQIRNFQSMKIYCPCYLHRRRQDVKDSSHCRWLVVYAARKVYC